MFVKLNRHFIAKRQNEHEYTLYMPINVRVVVARAEISGPSEKYLKPGSLLRLSCRIVENIENPLYIFWYHNSRMINYDTHRGVNVTTESGNLSVQ